MITTRTADPGVLRPGLLRGDVPAALTRGQRTQVAVFYALGERPERIAHAYDVPLHRIEKIVTDRGVTAGETASAGLTAYIRKVQALARSVFPLVQEQKNLTGELVSEVVTSLRLNSGPPVTMSSEAVQRLLREAHGHKAREDVSALGLDPDEVIAHLKRGRLPVTATLYTLAGIGEKEACRLDRAPLDVRKLTVLASLRGFTA